VAIGTKLDPSFTRSDSLIGSVIGKPDTLPENSLIANVEVNLFDSAVGTTEETKVLPIRPGESLRVNIGTAPVLSKVNKVKSNNIEIEFKRPVCVFEGGNIAISRRIADRWRLIGAGVLG
jgi:translation initiation factor 2 subunit 3